MKKVYWTTTELTILAEELALLRIEDPESSLGDLLVLAQDKLPPDRRRRNVKPSSVKGLTDMVKKSVLIASAPASVKEADTTSLLTALASRVTTTLEALDERLKAIEQLLLPKPKPQPPPTPAPVEPAPKAPVTKMLIVVVGPLPHQMEELCRRCRDLPVELRLVNKEHSPHFPSRSDYVLLWTRFVDHAWQTAAINQLGAAKVYRHAGGLEKMAELVQRISKGLPPKVYRRA